MTGRNDEREQWSAVWFVWSAGGPFALRSTIFVAAGVASPPTSLSSHRTSRSHSDSERRTSAGRPGPLCLSSSPSVFRAITRKQQNEPKAADSFAHSHSGLVCRVSTDRPQRAPQHNHTPQTQTLQSWVAATAPCRRSHWHTRKQSIRLQDRRQHRLQQRTRPVQKAAQEAAGERRKQVAKVTRDRKDRLHQQR